MTIYLDQFIENASEFTDHIRYEDFNYLFYISLQHKYLYVATPKVACTTIKHTLHQVELGTNQLHHANYNDIHSRECSSLLTPLQIYHFNKLIYNPCFFKFCFVRNPYSRVLSAYLDKIKKNTPLKKIILQKLGYNSKFLTIDLTFEDFIHAIVEQSITEMDRHWKIQYYLLLHDHIKYDFIGRFENFKLDFMKVLNKINGSKGSKSNYIVSQSQHATQATDKISEYYTEELRNIIYQKYKKDFEHFGYSEDINRVSDPPRKSIRTKMREWFSVQTIF